MYKPSLAQLRLTSMRLNSTEVDNDLRGFGETSALKESTPIAILTIRGNWQHPSATHLGLESCTDLFETAENIHHIRCINDQISHKIQAINLFAYSLLLQKYSQGDAILWLHNRLRHELHKGISLQSHAKVRITAPAPTSGNSIGLDPFIQLFLQQAGFSVKCQEEILHISPHEVPTYLTEFEGKSPVRTNQHAKGA